MTSVAPHDAAGLRTYLLDRFKGKLRPRSE
ncbi:hypothetical protein J2S55_008431 [Streptosporangium brasiliense]|uniref:Uncharacterized protein n=1 Tax=Streptosporangium brasiliense TaxID=47480 RepID=A0ABT9RLJ4_9ACTN|nr:hypothetical protein [Streptosporangium brasiliense]